MKATSSGRSSDDEVADADADRSGPPMDEDEARTCDTGGGNNPMTLEQFTDIVLASEGMTTDASDNDGKFTPSRFVSSTIDI